METIPDLYSVYGVERSEKAPPEISEVERIVNEFEAHESKEGKFTGRYKEIAARSPNPFVKFLLNLIISDEEKHQLITHAILSTLRSSLTWTRSEDAIRGIYDLGAERGELLKLTENFIRVEKDGIREYVRLIAATKHYYKGLLALLLASMLHDSEKHVKMLEFLRDRLREES